MTKQPPKRQQAATSKSASYSSDNTTKSSSLSQTTKPPAPLTSASLGLLPFLDHLNPAKCYLIHIDRHPPSFKRRIFAVPVALHLAIIILLLWRTYVALPHYLDLILLALGVPTRAVVDRSDKTTSDLLGITGRRALMIAGDFMLFRALGGWAYNFFVGEECSPFLWRWRIRFKPEEVVVRMSRVWGAAEFWTGVQDAGGVVVGMENNIVRDKVMPALDPEWMRERTGYMMMGKEWELDFEGMCRAHLLVERGEVSMLELEKCMVVYGGKEVGWCVWKVEGEGGGSLEMGESEEEARRRIGVFKDKLTKLGKESLFFRWIEMLQYYSTMPGGFTVERQKESLEKARELFERQGIDFDKFIKDVGGAQNFPGLDRASQR